MHDSRQFHVAAPTTEQTSGTEVYGRLGTAATWGNYGTEQRKTPAGWQPVPGFVHSLTR